VSLFRVVHTSHDFFGDQFAVHFFRAAGEGVCPVLLSLWKFIAVLCCQLCDAVFVWCSASKLNADEH